tara:strand:+ start:96 stop:833 length:738 start_codon:yes stop_codon:yes gene_type:complete
MRSPFKKKFNAKSPLLQRSITDPISNEQKIKNYYTARKATGLYENQLGDGQMDKGFANMENTEKVTRSEYEAKGYDTSGSTGGYGPEDNISFAEPNIFQRLMGSKAESTDLHEKVHQFEIGTTGKTGSSRDEDKKRYGNSSIRKAIKNIPAKPFGGEETAIDSYMDPQEVAAELVRFKIENKIDPAKIYNKKDLPKLRNKLKKEKAYGMFNINESYDDEGLLRLMNEVASSDKKQTPWINKHRSV